MARPKRVPVTPRLRDHRLRLGLTQEQLAERLGITPEMVRKHEKGLSTPSARYRAAYCALFGGDEVSLGFRSAQSAAVAVPAAAVILDAEDLSSVMARVQLLEARSVGSSSLDLLSDAVEDIVSRYEDEGPSTLLSPLTGLRLQVEAMMQTSAHPLHQRRLYGIAGRIAGMLGYMAVNRGRYPLARAYCREAFLLGEFGEDRDLQAWVRGTQSFCEYYAGDYATAVELARNGYQFAADGPQAVRLAVNGEARALAKLGDQHGVSAAVDQAYRLLERNPVVSGVSPGISFGGYSLARTASNAVTAYVDLGATKAAVEHAEVAMPEFELSDSRWSKSLIRLDLAKSLAINPDGDPDEAAGLVSRALDLSSGNLISSMILRSRDFLRVSGQRWRDVPAVVELREAVSSAHVT
jgi:transcriptional regulator with XRE-family HTH domain